MKNLKTLLTLLILLLTLQTTIAQQFTEQTNISLTGVRDGSVAWGDYDNDGNLDILLNGYSINDRISKIYKNNGNNTFTEQTGIALQVFLSGSVDWGDYDNDGDLDILLTGDGHSKIYKNNGDNTFTEQIDIALKGVEYSSATWGDYDNDGDLDIILTGMFGNNPDRYPISKIYKNNGDNTFTEQTGISLTEVWQSYVAWGDYDNDGDLDILLTGAFGTNPDYNPVSKIYRNNGDNSFTEQTSIALSGVYNGSVAWGDYDNDGNLDAILTGRDENDNDVSKIYKNNGPSAYGFTEQTGISLTGVASGSVAWGDYDNDGDLDILLTGNGYSKIYKNNGNNTFTEQTDISLTGVSSSSVAWGDYDNDGDLDILLTGDEYSKIYKNNGSICNTKPEIPANLQASITGDNVSLTWDKPIDSETLQAGLSYNIYVSTITEGNDINPAHADISTGYRRIVKTGNIRDNNFTINNLTTGTYYWSVQAIDHAFAGSKFATEGNFSISFTNSISPVDNQVLPPNEDGNPLTVIETETADSRQWKYSLFPGGPYNQIIAGETSDSYTPNFTEFNKYYVVCVSVRNGVSVTSNEVKIEIPQFIEQTDIALTDINEGSVAWGDYDNDGDLDILLTGSGTSKIYRNNGLNIFEDTGIALTGVSESSVAWGDYDNDGNLDILLSGNSGDNPPNPISKIYKNNGDGSFTEQAEIILPGIFGGSVALSDLDKDGDLDCILAGKDQNSDALSKIYWNINYEFIEASIYLKGGQSLDIADYNNDNYQDILIAGYDINGIKHTTLYKNNGNNTFTEQTDIFFTGVFDCSVAWGDYDNDGYLDILLAGSLGWPDLISKIYKNNGDNTFTEQTDIALTGVYWSSTFWGDYDNDGDLDILLTGQSVNGRISKIYKNNGDNSFSEQIDISLSAVWEASVAWGDYDNDRDLDIFLTGQSVNGRISKIYKNNNLLSNSEPDVPLNPQHELSGNHVKLYWDQANDAETPTQSLSYNVRVGTSPGAFDIVAPMSDITNGYKRIPDIGNTSLNNEFLLNNLDPGEYYWSVQTVDNGYFSSAFSAEQSFTILPTFTEQTGISLTDVGYGSIAWGDYDNDGYLDILLTGLCGDNFSKIYKNNGNNTFTEQTDIVLTEVGNSSVAWGDYDNDGDLDILLTGYNDIGGSISKIYKNNGDNSFTEQPEITLSGIAHGTAAWGDYDNDGDLDILLSGNPTSKIYKNNGNNSFTEQTEISLARVIFGSAAWGDYDNDGDLDILLTGQGDNNNPVSIIYKNNEDNGFTEQTDISLTGVKNSSVAWGDYDNDGDLDILITGADINENPVLDIYRNDGNNSFINIETLIRKVKNSSVAWGDYDNDGYLDILISGESGNNITKVYRNNKDGTFTDINADITGGYDGSLAWGDYDNDGDLDIVLSGVYFTEVYKNNTNSTNFPPTAPENFQNELSGFDMKLSWDKATDPNYPEGSLYYNIRVGTSAGAMDIMVPMASLTNGYRNIPTIGNAQCDTFWIIKNLIPGQPYYWSVQAIDQSFKGGEWAIEQTFTVPNLSADFETNSVCVGSATNFTDLSLSEGESITSWNWDFGDGNSSNLQNPTHMYETTGKYTVSLTINSASFEHQKIKEIIVKEAPVANFNIIQKGGLVCAFTNLSVTNEQTVLSWLWDFGDGNTSNLKTPPWYEYDNDGIYSVSLTVQTENACTDSISKTNLVCSSGLVVPKIYVRGPNVWYFASSNDSVENYRWYRNDELILDANDYIYVANQQLGTYYFEINNGGECWVPSEKITIPDDFYNGNAKKMEEAFDLQNNETGTLVFPNPNDGKFTLLFKNDFTGKIYIRIKDINGKTIRQYYSDKNQNVFSEEMDLKKQGTGIYFIEIEYDGKNDVRKVVVE